MIHLVQVGDVSIHAPARGATVDSAGDPLSWQRFNPRAREGRDAFECASIASLSPFQSTRPRGARRSSRFILNVSMCFNPRAREGRDVSIYNISIICQDVSIHAPARGATRRNLLRIVRRTRFNPRAREGRDADRREQVQQQYMFQSTRPRGARLAGIFAFKRSFCFNPRAREGRDLFINLMRRQPRKVSIHAPARGATLCRVHASLSNKFQSTRPRGARQPRDVAVWRLNTVSIHAPARGATVNPAA